MKKPCLKGERHKKHWAKEKHLLNIWNILYCFGLRFERKYDLDCGCRFVDVAFRQCYHSITWCIVGHSDFLSRLLFDCILKLQHFFRAAFTSSWLKAHNLWLLLVLLYRFSFIVRNLFQLSSFRFVLVFVHVSSYASIAYQYTPVFDGSCTQTLTHTRRSCLCSHTLGSLGHQQIYNQNIQSVFI